MTTTYNVSSEGATFGNTDTTTLNGAIRTIDTGPAGNYVINITGDINLTSQLLAFNLPAGVTLTIEGNGHTIDGGNAYNGFFAYSGTVTIADLTIANAHAVGGAGASGGGGGAGLGGGLFIAGTSGSGGHDPGQAVIPNVTLNNVVFSNDAAVGGGGGAGASGGGGGLGGAGGHPDSSNSAAGGGGGIGLSAGGGDGISGSGGPGIVPGIVSGGGNGGAVESGGAGGGIGGGAGGIFSGGTGGFGGGGGGYFSGGPSSGGGGGGFGGGGGGSNAGIGGMGGFGGGGGASHSAGNLGGFGGGRASLGAGGGGLGAGGDIFVQQGGTLTIDGGSLSGGAVTVGNGGNGAGNGSAFGSGIFLQGNGTLTLAPAVAQTVSIADVITDQTGSGGNAGSWSLVLSGSGTLVLSGADTYSGGTTIDAGTLQLGNGGTTGSFVGGLTADNGVFAVDRSDTVTWSTTISGAGGFAQMGAGLTIFTAAESYTGGTTVLAGTLQLGPGGSLASDGNLIIDGGTLDLAGHDQTVGDLSGTGGFVTLGSGTLTAGTAESTTFAGAISGAGAMVKNGIGTLTFTGANSYTGGTTVLAGSFQLGAGGSLASDGNLTINGGTFDLNGHDQTIGNLAGTGGALTLNGGALTFGSADSTAYSGTISGPGGLTKNGSGIFTLVGNDGTTGTFIVAGTLQIGNGGTAGSLSGDVLDEATLVVDRSGAVTLTGTISGGGAFEQLGTGTTVLMAVDSVSGGTTISAGTLELGSGGSITANVTFADIGPSETFRLDAGANQLGGSIVGFAPNDDIDLGFLGFNAALSAVWQENGGNTGGTLSLDENGSTLATLSLAGQYVSENFFLSSDGNGGTDISLPVLANNPTVNDGQMVAVDPTIFTVSGTGISEYEVWFSAANQGAPALGSVTDNGNAIALNQGVFLSSLGGLEYTGGATPGTDEMWLRVNESGTWSGWVQADITDPGSPPPTVTANNPTVDDGQTIAVINPTYPYTGRPTVFTVSGSGISEYEVWFSAANQGAPALGSVTDNGNAIALNQGVFLNDLSGLDYTGGATAGTDEMWLRAYNGEWSSWVQADITDPGIPPATVTASNPTVDDGQTVAVDPTVFTVSGSGISEYEVWFSAANQGAPALGSVTDNGTAIALNQGVFLNDLSGLDYTGGATAGTDEMWMRAYNGTWSNWVQADITDPGFMEPAFQPLRGAGASQVPPLQDFMAPTGGFASAPAPTLPANDPVSMLSAAVSHHA